MVRSPLEICRDTSTMELEMIGPMPGTVIRRSHAGFFLHQACDVGGQAVDAGVKPAPVARRVIDDAHHPRR